MKGEHAMTENENPMQRIITRCWQDKDFKSRLVADPNAVLAAEGVVVPDGVTIRVLQDTDRQIHLVIPQKRVLTAAELDAVAGGYNRWFFKVIEDEFCR